VSIWFDESVDFKRINVIKRLNCLLDLSLIRLDIDNEDKGVVLLNLLHCALSVDGVHDNLVLVKSGLMWNGFAGISWVPSENEGLWLSECRRLPEFEELV
jgi:hypothetical protein